MGCECAQGYHFSRPLPAGALAHWIRARERDQLAAAPR
jgi:EAL domain-containing protein (putative c-di-GMP-specific phosphodiesterase class I)